MDRREFYSNLADSREALEHSVRGETWAKKNHKYIDRYRGKNGKWEYVYEDGSSTGNNRTAKLTSISPKVNKGSYIEKDSKDPFNEKKNVVTREERYNYTKTNTNHLFDKKYKLKPDEYYDDKAEAKTTGIQDAKVKRVHEVTEYGKLHVMRKAAATELSALLAPGTKRLQKGLNKLKEMLSKPKDKKALPSDGPSTGQQKVTVDKYGRIKKVEDVPTHSGGSLKKVKGTKGTYKTDSGVTVTFDEAKISDKSQKGHNSQRRKNARNSK